MIFHTTYTMSIGRYALMVDNGQINKVARVWLPDILCMRRSRQMQVDFTQMFSKNVLDKDIYLVMLYNRITLFKALYIGLTLKRIPEMVEFYEANFGRKFTKLDDLKVVEIEISRLQSKYRNANIQPEEEDKGKTPTFEDMVSGVELISGYAFSPKMTLQQFKARYDTALKKAKINTE